MQAASPWDVAAVEAIDAQTRAERSRRWWQPVSAHIRDVPKTVDWAVANFAAGIALYFIAPFEPHLGIAALVALAAALLWFISERRDLPWVGVALLAFAIFGFARGTWHTQATETPLLDEGFYVVTGWVEAVEPSGSGERWRIRVHDIEGRGAVETVKRVRVKIHKGSARAGDAVTVKAVLSAMPGPVVPGGYDPGRRAYFNGISGTGFSTAEPTAAKLESRSGAEAAARGVARFRYGLADRILSKAPEETSGLQVALLTGIRSYIPEAQTEALRTAGLAHVLAISGLHMGLLAGGAYWLASLLLACIAPLSRRYDMRKPAAIIGALAATAYLILSGASVATQRAYVMALIVFLAVILDRRAFSIRSVSIAAFITLALHPENLMSAGFQMSFSAVIALVIVYRNWQGPTGEGRTLSGRFISGLATLSITSFVAGAATGAYAIMHFNRLAKFGFVGNLIAMPIFTFLVMPAALAALIAMPFGLEWAPLQIMGWSLSLLLDAANWVSSWPSALAHIKSPPDWVIGAYSLGFLWLCLGGIRLRLVAAAVFSMCLLAWSLTPVPDIRVSDSGRVAILTENAVGGNQTLYVGSTRADTYGREQFIQRSGIDDPTVEKYKDTLALCDALACRLTINGHAVSIASHPSEVPQECRRSSVVILVTREAGPVARRNCDAALIDAQSLKTNGAYDIYLGGQTPRFKISSTAARKSRPWGKDVYRRE